MRGWAACPGEGVRHSSARAQLRPLPPADLRARPVSPLTTPRVWQWGVSVHWYVCVRVRLCARVRVLCVQVCTCDVTCTSTHVSECVRVCICENVFILESLLFYAVWLLFPQAPHGTLGPVDEDRPWPLYSY